MITLYNKVNNTTVGIFNSMDEANEINDNTGRFTPIDTNVTNYIIEAQGVVRVTPSRELAIRYFDLGMATIKKLQLEEQFIVGAW